MVVRNRGLVPHRHRRSHRCTHRRVNSGTNTTNQRTHCGTRGRGGWDQVHPMGAAAGQAFLDVLCAK